MKKNILRVVAIILVVVFLTTCAVSSTFAKYVTQGEAATETARVAKWGVTIKTDISTLFLDKYDMNTDGKNEVISFNGECVVAPGTANLMTVKTILTGKPEVALEITMEANVELDNWEVDGVYYCPLVFTIDGSTRSGLSFETADEFENWIEGRIAKFSKQYPPLTDLSTVTDATMEIGWRWPFEVDEDNDPTNGISNDKKDTVLGNMAADDDETNDPVISFSLRQTASQIEDYEFIYNRNDKIIEFGTYPQSKVDNADLIAKLEDKAGTLPTSGNSQEWTSYGYYANGAVSDYMWYIDVFEGGSKYRGVYITDYRMAASNNAENFQGQNGYAKDDVYWFKYEKIKWRILQENDGTALVLAQNALDSQAFDNGQSSNYAESDIRAWLNSSFYSTAFTAAQRAIINSTLVRNGAEETMNQSDPTCIDVEDDIFLLSFKEATNPEYGFSVQYEGQEGTVLFPDRVIEGTEYAMSQGLFVKTVGDKSLAAQWWTRTAHSAELKNEDNKSYRVRPYGAIGWAESNLTTIGVVPALYIQLREPSHECDDADHDHNCDKCDAPLSSHKYQNGECICGKQIYIREFDKITFGSYPQTDVTSTAVASTLNARVGTPATKASEWTSYGYYASGSQSDYMWYTDVEEGGVMYRGVYMSSYRPEKTTSAATAANSNQDNNGYSTGNVYWFRYDPISWCILSENTNNGTALLLADLILDSQPFYISTDKHNGIRANNYEHSTIRSWLNDHFYETAFEDIQKSLIIESLVDNSKNSGNDSDNVSSNTLDKIFLLSLQDLKDYTGGYPHNNYGGGAEAYRRKSATSYARIQGVDVPSQYSPWWSRTAQNAWSDEVAVVEDDGILYAYSGTSVVYTEYGVLPALRIKL